MKPMDALALDMLQNHSIQREDWQRLHREEKRWLLEGAWRMEKNTWILSVALKDPLVLEAVGKDFDSQGLMEVTPQQLQTITHQPECVELWMGWMREVIRQRAPSLIDHLWNAPHYQELKKCALQDPDHFVSALVRTTIYKDMIPQALMLFKDTWDTLEHAGFGMAEDQSTLFSTLTFALNKRLSPSEHDDTPALQPTANGVKELIEALMQRVPLSQWPSSLPVLLQLARFIHDKQELSLAMAGKGSLFAPKPKVM